VRWAALALILCTAATCLNPYGPHLLATVFRVNRVLISQGIPGWLPTVLPAISTLPFEAKAFAASVLVVLVTLRLSPRSFSATDVLLLAVFGVAAWFVGKLLPWWMTLCPWVLLPHWRAILTGDKVTRRQGDKVTRDGLFSHLFTLSPCLLVTLSTIAIAIALLLMSGSGRWLLRGPRPAGQQVTAATPVELTAKLKEQLSARPARVLATDVWNDYLLWELPASAQLFTYGQYQMLPLDRLVYWGRMISMRPAPSAQRTALDRYNWRGLLDYFRIDVLALSAEGASQRLFAHFQGGKEPGWRVVYVNDDQTALLAMRER
jgi:hypothetical protein